MWERSLPPTKNVFGDDLLSLTIGFTTCFLLIFYVVRSKCCYSVLISQFSLVNDVNELFCLAKVVPAELCAGSEEPLLILDEFPGGRGWKKRGD